MPHFAIVSAQKIKVHLQIIQEITNMREFAMNSYTSQIRYTCLFSVCMHALNLIACYMDSMSIIYFSGSVKSMNSLLS